MKKQWFVCFAVIACALDCPVRVLADAFISSVLAGSQSPAMTAPGGTATYTVTVMKTNSGGLDAYLSVSGLPAGTTASFSPSPIVLKSGDPVSGAATLTVMTSTSTPAGVYALTVTARDGGSHNSLAGTAQLIVGVNSSNSVPTIASICGLQNQNVRITGTGIPQQVFLIQATTNLLVSSWINIATNATDASGAFTLIDADGGHYPRRFYRTAEFFPQ